MVGLKTLRHAPTCVWMDAGIVSYKLCDRRFDCAHCPFDAALRGTARPGDGDAEAAGGGLEFPDDRLYASGHTWLQPRGPAGMARFGLDAFAAGLLGPVRSVRCRPWPRLREAGEALCRLELAESSLDLGAPLPLRVTRWNESLAADAGLVSSAPYDRGWLAEVRLSCPQRTAELLPAAEALSRARLEARRLRRRAAFELLRGDETAGTSSLGGLRRLLAGCADYTALVRELIR